MKPKTSGNEPEGIVNKDLGYVSQIFLPKTMGNDTVPCGFVYVIAPKDIYYGNYFHIPKREILKLFAKAISFLISEK